MIEVLKEEFIYQFRDTERDWCWTRSYDTKAEAVEHMESNVRGVPGRKGRVIRSAVEVVSTKTNPQANADV